MATWMVYKNGLLGGAFTTLSSRHGDEKGEASHVRLTASEYDKLIEARDSYKKQFEDEKAAHAKDVSTLNQKAKTYKDNADAEARKKVNAANERAEAAEEEAERQASLNKNLLRIIRERANAKRGLKPKRKHPGYRFIGKIMQTKAIAGHDKRVGAVYADVWTATLETPYDGTIPIHQIQDRIFSDLMETEGILQKLYVEYFTYKDNKSVIWKGSYSEAIYEADMNKNYLFDYKFMINPKSRLWEIQITTTKSIRPLAEMMG